MLGGKVDNVIILTSGISGSSALSSLLAESGYWVGNQTKKKNNGTGRYDTFENGQLVDINQALIDQKGIKADEKFWYQNEEISAIVERFEGVDLSDASAFIRECEARSPWIWKDPKLWRLLPLWANLFDLSKTRFIVIYRDPLALWFSQTSKRIIYDYGYLSAAEESARDRMQRYLESIHANVFFLRYDDLVKKPEVELVRLSEFLGTEMTIQNWRKVYRKPRSGVQELVSRIKAVLIYLKNYSSRIR